MNFKERKTVVFLFNSNERGYITINKKVHKAPETVLLNEAIKSPNFDLFEDESAPSWFEDVRNFSWFTKELKTTPYVFASRAHHADIIIRVRREQLEDGFGEGFTFTKIDKRKTERETLDALLLDGLLRCEEIMMTVGRFEGGIINNKYSEKRKRIA